MIGFKGSRTSPKNYFLWRIERARPAVEKVNNIYPLKGSRVLDIGCGYGSLVSVLSDYGAKVSATEVDKLKLNHAKQFIKNNRNITLKLVHNEKLPFPDNSFDVVFLFDVIEHVSNPQITLKEAYRVLTKGGILYVEFTPYYSIVGHHLYDFSKLPIHALPTSWVKKIVFSKKVRSFITPHQYWDQFLSLNKLKITQFQNMTKRFKLINESFIIKYPEVAQINLPLLNYLGPFKDLFTMSYEGTFKKS